MQEKLKLHLGENSLIIISGIKNSKGGNLVLTKHDHRIAMSMLILGFFPRKPIVIDDMKMIKTSFPTLKKLFVNLMQGKLMFQK